MEMHDLDDLGRLARDLALEAGDIVRRGREKGFGVVSSKSTETDIVTEIDRASEDHIVSALRSRRPDDEIVAEEGSAFTGTSGVRWLIDPLDGTVNFTYGIPIYAVSIGAEIDGVPVVGAVYSPATDELFHATKGRGAFRNDEGIEVREGVALDHVLLATGFGYAAERREQQAETLRHVLPLVRDIRRGGSAALDMCAVACGRIDAYYELGVWPWDVTGGSVIVTEAGGIVSGFESERAERSVIAASNSETHSQLRSLLSRR